MTTKTEPARATAADGRTPPPAGAPHPLRHVALIVESAVAPRRMMLTGVARYVQEHQPWSIYLKPFGVEQSLPAWLENWHGDGIIAHVADFEIVRDGTPFLMDVVTDEDLAKHPMRAAALHGIAAADGRLFTIETAASIRAEPRFATVRLIMACKRTPVTAGDRVRILHQLDESGAMRLVDCASAVMNTADGVAAVLALACEGLIAVDISRPILPETQVRRRRLPYTDPFGF